MNEIEILDLVVGGQKIREMSAISFLGWVANKINGVSAFSADAQTVIQRVANPPMGRMIDEDKIDIVRRMERLGIQIN